MTLKKRNRRIIMAVALCGTISCIGGVAAFFLAIVNNTLPWEHAPTAQEHYLAVGKSYSQGFTIGFFLAFSLALVAITFAAWAEDRRRARRAVAAAAAAAAEASVAAEPPSRARLVLELTAPR